MKRQVFANRSEVCKNLYFSAKKFEKGVDKGEEVWYTSEAVPENGQRDLEN